jgi:hypothetical protein
MIGFWKNIQGLSKGDLMDESNKFIREYFPRIAVRKTDTEEEKEIKKLKKILLFEVSHEDARPLLPRPHDSSFAGKPGSSYWRIRGRNDY